MRQLLGLFDVPPAAESTQSWHLPDLSALPASWQVVAIVGPSGAGKSTIARELFGHALVGPDGPGPWPADKSIVDGFPPAMGIKDVTGLLSSVGFSSPPAWLRPFRCLSTGQQFRANLARTLAECNGRLAAIDEFTSVVDRTVAQVGSAAVAKAVRRRPGQQFVAVTCHYDVLDWLEPDWVIEVSAGGECHLQQNEGPDGSRGSLWRRPAIELQVVRTDRSAWPLFAPHHYLDANLSPRCQCYVALYAGRPAAFTAALPFPHNHRPGWREHRTVCLPDFQGVGIGNALSEFVASLYVSRGTPYYSTTSHPAMIRHRARSPLWRMIRKPSLQSPHTGRGNVKTGMRKTSSADRLTAGFEYVGPARAAEARACGVIVRRPVSG